MFEEWFDEYKMIQLTNPPKREDNGMMFTTELNFLIELSGDKVEIRRYESMVLAHQISKGVYSQTPWNGNDPGSHDNITPMVSYSFKHGLEFHKTLEIYGKFWHPRDVIFYCYCRRRWYDLWAFPALPILSLFQIHSFFRKYKFRQENRRDHIVKSTAIELLESIKEFWGIGTLRADVKRHIQTDGKKIGWSRCHGTMHKSITMKVTYYICNLIMSKLSLYKGKGHWHNLFRQYYTESGDAHPINILSKKLYLED